MARTDRLFVVRQRLAAQRATLAADDPRGPRLDSATRATLRADDAMTDWMHAYHPPAAGTAPDSAAAYFTRQLHVLATIDVFTRRALDSAAVLLPRSVAPSP